MREARACLYTLSCAQFTSNGAFCPASAPRSSNTRTGASFTPRQTPAGKPWIISEIGRDATTHGTIVGSAGFEGDVASGVWVTRRKRGRVDERRARADARPEG